MNLPIVPVSEKSSRSWKSTIKGSKKPRTLCRKKMAVRHSNQGIELAKSKS